MRIQKFFGTVEEFVTPLIDILTPINGETAQQALLKNSGRIAAWLTLSYGSENIKKLMELINKTSIDFVINILVEKNVKTLGRFAKVLDEIEKSLI